MLEDLRAALEAARPAQFDMYACVVGTNGGQLPGRALGIEELEAVAATARDKGHQAGYALAQEHLRRHQETALAEARKEAETRGGLAGISTSVAALQRRREALRESASAERVVETLSAVIDELETLYDGLNEAGMHGERQRDEAQDGAPKVRVG